MSFTVGIVGGGVAGSTIALSLAKLGINSVLFEASTSLINGPPMCHLHAGGALYRQIPTDQCIKLLKESIQTVKFYKYAVNKRPTVLAVPKRDPGSPDQIINRLKIITQEYKKLIQQDKCNEVLGSPQEYFKVFTKQELLLLRQLDCPSNPKTPQDWMIPPTKYLDLDKLKFPLVMVQEYGLSSMRISAFANIGLQRSQYCEVLKNTTVISIKQNCLKNWEITYTDKQTKLQQTKTVNYLVNACGYQSGKIDDMVGYKKKRMVQFKTSYITQWSQCPGQWPQIVIHGKRKTPQGMAQLTPYSGNLFQIHGMTEQITLFKQGYVYSNDQSSQPVLNTNFTKILQQGWDFEQVKNRTKNAIQHVSQFIPSFRSANVTKKPLYGAQQIPGSNADLRATQMSYQSTNYARAQIVKASTAIKIAQDLINKLQAQHNIEINQQNNDKQKLQKITSKEVLYYACKIAEQRNYPKQIAQFYQ